MTATTESTDQRRLDDLRRRLYRADATDADLQRYLEQRPEGPERALPGSPTSQPSMRRPLIGAAIGLVAVVALVAGVLLGQPAAPPTARPSTPAAVADATAVLGPTRVAVSIDGTAVTGLRFEGSGSVVLPFDPPPRSYDGGRAVVALITTEPGPVVWRALRMATRRDWTSFPQVVAQGAAIRPAAADAPVSFSYNGLPPTRIAVEAPVGTRWRLEVAITGDAAPTLR